MAARTLLLSLSCAAAGGARPWARGLPARLGGPRIAPLLRRGLSATVAQPLTALSSDENMLRESVAKFARERIAPLSKAMDEEARTNPDLMKELFQQGLMGIEVPTEFGGGGLSFFQAILAVEEVARVDPAIAVLIDIQNTLVNTCLAKYGSDAQKKRYFPRLVRDTVASFCLSEAGSGSDAFAMKTRAERRQSKYVLNGTKMWISNAQEAGIFLVFANADLSRGYKGITAFVVERDSKGLSIGKPIPKLGIRASSTCEVVLEGVEVPEENVIGEPGKGYKIAIELLNEGRIGIGAQMVGLAQGAFDATMPYLFQRKQFGQVIGGFQGMQFSYARARTEIETARLMVYNAARLKEAGLPFIKEAAMCKLVAGEVAERVASQAVEWMGGLGFTKESPQEKFFRDSKIGAIYEGTTNLQLQTIAGLVAKEFGGGKAV
jgi:butyryl-CoA dehydrogenase/short/branched chain acyl-CoA dehydrogenase